MTAIIQPKVTVNHVLHSPLFIFILHLQPTKTDIFTTLYFQLSMSLYPNICPGNDFLEGTPAAAVNGSYSFTFSTHIFPDGSRIEPVTLQSQSFFCNIWNVSVWMCVCVWVIQLLQLHSQACLSDCVFICVCVFLSNACPWFSLINRGHVNRSDRGQGDRGGRAGGKSMRLAHTEHIDHWSNTATIDWQRKCA